MPCSASRLPEAMGLMRPMGRHGHAWDRQRNGRSPVRALRGSNGWRAGRAGRARAVRARRPKHMQRFAVRSPSSPFSPSCPNDRPPSAASDTPVTWPTPEAPASGYRPPSAASDTPVTWPAYKAPASGSRPAERSERSARDVARVRSTSVDPRPAPRSFVAFPPAGPLGSLPAGRPTRSPPYTRPFARDRRRCPGFARGSSAR